MKLHLANTGSQNVFTAYGAGFVAVNQRRIETSVIVLPAQLIEPWNVTALSSMTEADFQTLAALPVEVVLLGTGGRLRFPHPRYSEPLRQANIGLEIMDTPAACRTYNILLGEGRRVAAALLID